MVFCHFFPLWGHFGDIGKSDLLTPNACSFVVSKIRGPAQHRYEVKTPTIGRAMLITKLSPETLQPEHRRRDFLSRGPIGPSHIGAAGIE